MIVSCGVELHNVRDFTQPLSLSKLYPCLHANISLPVSFAKHMYACLHFFHTLFCIPQKFRKDTPHFQTNSMYVYNMQNITIAKCAIHNHTFFCNIISLKSCD